MLKVTLDQNDRIEVGKATIHLLEAANNTVCIGIRAPNSMPVTQRKAKHSMKKARKKTLTELMI